MGTVMAIVGWVMGNWQTVVEIALAALGVAGMITGLTNSPKASGVIGTLRAWLERLSPVTSKDKPGTFKVPGTSSKDSFF